MRGHTGLSAFLGRLWLVICIALAGALAVSCEEATSNTKGHGYGATDPIDVVRADYMSWLEEDYTISMSVLNAEVDGAETRRIIEMYKGSELAESRGWTDEILERHFVVVRVRYECELDHARTFLRDGLLEAHVYLTRDPNSGVWTIVDRTSPSDIPVTKQTSVLRGDTPVEEAAAPTGVAAPATAEPNEQDPWGQVRAAVLPLSVPVYRPAFMPERFGQPELVAAGAYNYTVVYRAPYEIAGNAPFELVAFYSGMPEGALANSPGDPSQEVEEVSIAGQHGTMVAITEADPAVLQVKFLGAFWQRDGKPYGIKAYSNLMTVEEFRQIIDGMEEVP